MVLNPTPFKILSLSLVSSKLIGLYLGIVFFQLICLGIIEILGSMVYSFHQSWKFWGHYFFPFFLSCSLSRTAVTRISGHLKPFHSTDTLFVIFSISFFLYFTAVSIAVFPSLLIFFSSETANFSIIPIQSVCAFKKLQNRDHRL